MEGCNKRYTYCWYVNDIIMRRMRSFSCIYDPLNLRFQCGHSHDFFLKIIYIYKVTGFYFFSYKL